MTPGPAGDRTDRADRAARAGLTDGGPRAGQTDGAHGAPAAGWQDAWLRALEDVELGVEEAERLLARLHPDAPDDAVAHPPLTGAWAPPTGLGPLPESLEERARIVLARQLQVAERLAAAAVRSRQQLAFARRADVTAPARPLFVDAAF
jgi:hypothetical protein